MLLRRGLKFETVKRTANIFDPGYHFQTINEWPDLGLRESSLIEGNSLRGHTISAHAGMGGSSKFGQMRAWEGGVEACARPQAFGICSCSPSDDDEQQILKTASSGQLLLTPHPIISFLT